MRRFLRHGPTRACNRHHCNQKAVRDQAHKCSRGTETTPVPERGCGFRTAAGAIAADILNFRKPTRAASPQVGEGPTSESDFGEKKWPDDCPSSSGEIAQGQGGCTCR